VQIKPWLFLIYCKIYFKLIPVSSVARSHPQLLHLKGKKGKGRILI